MVSAFRYLLLVIGGFTAGVVLAAPSEETYVDAIGFGGGSLSDADVTAVAVGAVAAVLVAMLCRRRRQVVTVLLLGCVLTGVVALPGAWSHDIHFATIGAGLLLGGLSVLCLGPQRLQRQTALSGAVVAGLCTAVPIAEYREFAAAVPGRYAEYVAVSEQPANPVWLWAAVLVVAALVAASVSGALDPAGDAVARWDIREPVVGAVLSVVAVVLYWSLDRALYSSTNDAGGGRWWFGVVVVPVVIVAALWLRQRTGMVLLAGAALFVSLRDAEKWVPAVWPMLLVPVVLVAFGTWLARRRPIPLAGIALLALCAASAVFERSPWDTVHMAAMLFGVPFAAAYTIVAALPSTAPVTATSLALPAVMSLPLMVEFGWTSYTPLTDDTGWTAYSSAPSGPSAWTVLSVSVSVVSLLACGAAMAWLQHRRSGGGVAP
ncbi:hypothetical protein [Rhodococcus yananensis]|uniref:hypothetical protein n=1 Tax=Rhodococcus yananensis TaxID=2879464 RepID=UPI003EB7D01F